MSFTTSPTSYISFADQFVASEGSVDMQSWLANDQEGSTIECASISDCISCTESTQLFDLDLTDLEDDIIIETTSDDSLLFAEANLSSSLPTRGYLDFPLPAEPTTITSRIRSTASWIAKQFAHGMTEEKVLAMSWGAEPCLSDAECGWSDSCGSESDYTESESSGSSSSSSSAASLSTCPSTPPRSSPNFKRVRSSPTSSNSSRRYLSDRLIRPSPIPPRQRKAAESRKRAARSELGDGDRTSALSWPFPAPSSEVSSVAWIKSQLPAPLQFAGAMEKAKYEQQQKLDRWFEGLSAASVEHLELWEGWIEEAGKVYTAAEVQTVLLDLEARGLLEMGGARGVAERELKRIAGEREGWLW